MCRVLGLLDEFLKRAPRSELIPEIALPLLSALNQGASGKGSDALSEKLHHILQSRVWKSRMDSTAAALFADRAAVELRKVLHIASRTSDKRVARTASKCYAYLVHLAVQTPKTTEVRSAEQG